MIPFIICVAFALIATAACSLSEAALYSVPLSYIETLRKKKSAAGRRLAQFRENIDRPIAAILALNTIANTAGASLAGAFAAGIFNETGMVIFTILFTLALLVASEIIPKTLGVLYCRIIAPAISLPLAGLLWILSPLLFVTGLITRLITSKNNASPATEDDIRAMVSLSRSAGSIKAYEENAIRNILGLDSRYVKDVMTPRPVIYSLPASLTVEEAHDSKNFWNYSRIPVYKKDREDIVGLARRGDIMKMLLEDRDSLPLESLMRPVHFVPETMRLDRLLAQFLDHRTHLYVVLDEYGGLAGVVTLEDVLEEILGGEIVDETDSVSDLQALSRTQQREIISRNCHHS